MSIENKEQTISMDLNAITPYAKKYFHKVLLSGGNVDAAKRELKNHSKTKMQSKPWVG